MTTKRGYLPGFPRFLVDRRSSVFGDEPVENMLNLGPKTGAWLRGVGITTRQQLVDIGPIVAFKRIEKAGFSNHLLLLYALAGAVMDTNCMELPEGMKADLRRQVGRL